MTPSTKEYQASRRRAIELKQYLFLGFLMLMGFIGLLWFARPTESTLEKRELTKFPSPELWSICDGSFFSQADKWYSDTYPLRESLIGMNFSMQRLYGFRGEQMINGGGKADEIPTGTVDLEALAGKSPAEAPADTGSADSDPAAGTQASADSGTETVAPTETEPDGHGAANYDGSLEKNEKGIYLAHGTGYGVYGFQEKPSARYCLLVNQLAKNLADKAQLYSLLCPISSGVMLSDERQKAIGASDENEAIQWFYRNMDPSVKTVSVFNTLRAHNDEYIFFRTDHHWTALGAYYAYQEWCKVKGVEPHALSDFETRSFEGFLGSFYSETQDAAMAANPDTVIAYVPKGTNSMKTFIKQSEGVYQEFDWSIINDVSDWAKGALYNTFAGGDQPYNSVHNETITDGSSVLVVKDSFADAFIPFLIDHYEYIYWIDFRSYKKWSTWAGQPDPGISALVARKNIQDVILCQNIQIVGGDGAVDVMESIFK